MARTEGAFSLAESVHGNAFCHSCDSSQPSTIVVGGGRVSSETEKEREREGVRDLWQHFKLAICIS